MRSSHHQLVSMKRWRKKISKSITKLQWTVWLESIFVSTKKKKKRRKKHFSMSRHFLCIRNITILLRREMVAEAKKRRVCMSCCIHSCPIFIPTSFIFSNRFLAVLIVQDMMRTRINVFSLSFLNENHELSRCLNYNPNIWTVESWKNWNQFLAQCKRFALSFSLYVRLRFMCFFTFSLVALTWRLERKKHKFPYRINDMGFLYKKM